MTSPRRSAHRAILPIALLVAACSGAVGPSGIAPSASPGPTDTPVGTIAHPDGPTDVILRLEEGGGFVPFGFLLTQAPEFTLYGDGTAIVRNERQDPLPDSGGVARMHPFRTVQLAEADIQALLSFALVQGGLGSARPHYEHNQVADAPSAVFTIDADGARKVVEVYALGIDGAPALDVEARRAFMDLADRLRSLAADPQFATAAYQPQGYRAVLSEGFEGNPERPWPWPAIAPDAFGPANPNGPFLLQRVRSPAEVAAIGVEGFEGGLLNAMLRGTDGTLYALSTRPLLPEEAE